MKFASMSKWHRAERATTHLRRGEVLWLLLQPLQAQRMHRAGVNILLAMVHR